MSNELPQLPKPTVMLPEFVDGVGEYEEPMFDSMSMREYGRACERAAYARAMEACTITCAKNHAAAATFRSGTKAYVAGCDDCHDAIRKLGADK